jgi:hypothetical protein
MTKTYEAQLREIDKQAKKLKNALKRSDLDYTVQISMNSAQPGEINYALSMTAPAAGLAPIMYITHNYEDLLALIKTSQKKFDPIGVERAYHEAQIDACEKTIQGHKERLEDMDKEGEEQVEETTENTEK